MMHPNGIDIHVPSDAVAGTPVHAPVVSQNLLHCDVALPFPNQFHFEPLLKHALLTRMGKHWLYHPSILAWCLAIAAATTVSAKENLSDVFGGLLYGTLLLWSYLWMIIALTRMDRRLCSALIHSFEWWWLLLNILMYGMSLLLDSGASVTFVLESLTLPLCYLYVFSLDALVHTSRWTKVAILSMVVLVDGADLLFLRLNRIPMLHPDRSICVLVYCTTVHTMHASSIFTILVFASKYLAMLLFKPNHLQIISTRIACTIDDAHVMEQREESDPLVDNALNAVTNGSDVLSQPLLSPVGRSIFPTDSVVVRGGDLVLSAD
jgi:hypothetical protein